MMDVDERLLACGESARTGEGRATITFCGILIG